jgi:hypothetical protein
MKVFVVLALFLIIAIVYCEIQLTGNLINKYQETSNKTKAADTVRKYAQYLNEGNCESWAKLFIPTGVKYDEPKPIIGYAQLVRFCQDIKTKLPSFYYTLLEPPMVINSGGMRLISKWLIGGVDGNGKAVGQTGIGSYVLNEQYHIIECTCYDYIPRN